MSRPTDIPDDVMKAAADAAADYLRVGTNCSDHFARAIMAERERLRPVIHDLYIELIWDAFNAGIVRDGKWMDGAISDAEHLRADLGLGDSWHDGLAVQAMLPDLARRKADAAIRGETA